MSFAFHELDDKTRDYMLEELECDVAAGELYIGRQLNDQGRDRYPAFLRTAIESGDSESLAGALGRVPGDLWIESTVTRNGRTSTTPRTAPTTLDEGQFNRFYMRGLALRAIDGNLELEVYRAKQVESPRASSEAIIGSRIAPQSLLDDLRTDPSTMPFDFHLGNANSGLSVRLR